MPDNSSLQDISDFIESPLDSRTQRWGNQINNSALQTLQGGIKAFAIFPNDNRMVTVGHPDRSCRIWDLETLEEDGEKLDGYSSTLLSVSVSRKGTHIVAGDDEGRVIVWDASTRGVMKRFSTSSTQVTCVAFETRSPPLKVVSSGLNATINVWGISTGPDAPDSQALKKIRVPTNIVYSISFCPSPSYRDRVIAVAAGDKRIYIADVNSGEILRSFFAHGSLYTSSVVWFPGGRKLASCGDTTICVWDGVLDSKSDVPLSQNPFFGHSRLVKSIDISPDGRFIASGSDDGTVRIWNAVNGVQVGKSICHSVPIKAVAFSLNGQMIYSADVDGAFFPTDISKLEVEEELRSTNQMIRDLMAYTELRTVEANGQIDDLNRKVDAVYESQDDIISCLEGKMKKMKTSIVESSTRQFEQLQESQRNDRTAHDDDITALHSALQDFKVEQSEVRKEISDVINLQKHIGKTLLKLQQAVDDNSNKILSLISANAKGKGQKLNKEEFL